MSRKSRRNRRREAERIRNQPPDLPPQTQAPDVQGDPEHQALVERGPELKAALSDNTAMLMGLRDRAEASLDMSYGIDEDAHIMQDRLREAMLKEKDPARKLKLEAAYLEACKRRAQGAQGIALGNLLHRSIPLTPMAKE